MRRVRRCRIARRAGRPSNQLDVAWVVSATMAMSLSGLMVLDRRGG